eukprot:58877-Chlamydomonas_euryale.AAC.3
MVSDTQKSGCGGWRDRQVSVAATSGVQGVGTMGRLGSGRVQGVGTMGQLGSGRVQGVGMMGQLGSGRMQGVDTMGQLGSGRVQSVGTMGQLGSGAVGECKVWAGRSAPGSAPFHPSCEAMRYSASRAPRYGGRLYDAATLGRSCCKHTHLHMFQCWQHVWARCVDVNTQEASEVCRRARTT